MSNDFITLDQPQVLYGIWTRIYARRLLSRFAIPLFITISFILFLVVKTIRQVQGELPQQPGDHLFTILIVLGSSYYLSAVTWRCYTQWLLTKYGQSDVAVLNEVECYRKETEWWYWKATYSTHRTGVMGVVKFHTRPEVEPIKPGNQVRVLYHSPTLYLLQ